jgi:hypothetical protein
MWGLSADSIRRLFDDEPGFSLSETRIISTSDVIVLSAFPNP